MKQRIACGYCTQKKAKISSGHESTPLCADRRLIENFAGLGNSIFLYLFSNFCLTYKMFRKTNKRKRETDQKPLH